MMRMHVYFPLMNGIIYLDIISCNVSLLQRNLKIMINMGLSAKKEKDDRFQQKKKEVIEMIKMQAPSIDSEVYFRWLAISFNTFEFVIFMPIPLAMLLILFGSSLHSFCSHHYINPCYTSFFLVAFLLGCVWFWEEREKRARDECEKNEKKWEIEFDLKWTAESECDEKLARRQG